MSVCVSCGRQSKDKSVAFPCPGCGKEVRRCSECKEKGNKYRCQNCGFQGP